jgi:hypothetical protein
VQPFAPRRAVDIDNEGLNAFNVGILIKQSDEIRVSGH